MLSKRADPAIKRAGRVERGGDALVSRSLVAEFFSDRGGRVADLVDDALKFGTGHAELLRPVFDLVVLVSVPRCSNARRNCCVVPAAEQSR